MKKANIKNLIVRGVIPVAMTLIMSGCGLSANAKDVESWYDKDSAQVEAKMNIDVTPETEAEMVAGDSREKEALETLERLLVNDTAKSSISTNNWDEKKFTCEREAAFWNFIDDNFLSEYDYISIMDRKLLLDAIDSVPQAFMHEPGLIYICKEFTEENVKEQKAGALIVRFDENGRVGFDYLYLNNADDAVETDDNIVDVRYSPYGGYLVIASASSPKSSKTNESYAYEIPEEKNIEMINQLVALYTNQATPVDVLNNVDAIANANYNVNSEYVKYMK